MVEVIGKVTTLDIGPLCPSGTWNVIEVIKNGPAMFFVTDQMHFDEDEGEVPLVIADILVSKFEFNEKYQLPLTV